MRKFKRFLAITMALSMVFSTNAFATPITLTDSDTNASKTDTLDKTNGTDYFADEDTNNWQNGSITEEVRVNVKRASFFNITIPKEIVLNGNNGSATYEVSITGELAGDQSLVVKPDDSFQLTEDGGKTTPVTVTQTKDTFNYQDIDNSVKGNGTLSASGISAGNWNGRFNFNIEFLAKPKTFNDYSWAEIAAISEAGNAASTFSVGDEKELQIGSETYHIQILGFAHDDKSDGTGKAGITVGLKEIMTTTAKMNDTNTNVGGWKDSKMRTYVNNDVYSALPSDLQRVIKTVNKVSDNGNMDTTTLNTTQDKLFLLSTTEVGLNPSGNVNGQGTKYEYFTDNTSRVKKKLSGKSNFWWLRSAITHNTYRFHGVNVSGLDGISNANDTFGVVFGFSI